MNGPQIVRRPLVAAAIGFTLGIAAAPSASPAADLFTLGVLLAAVVYLAQQRRILSMLLVPLPFFFAGLTAGTARLPPAQTITAQRSVLNDRGVVVEGLVAEAVARGPDADRVLLDVIGTSTTVTGPLLPAQGRVALWITDHADCGAPGDRIRAWVRLRAPTEALMPGRLGPRAVAARQGVALYGSVRDSSRCVVVQPSARGGLRTGIERVRAAMHTRIDDRLTARRAAIVRAFATGDRSGIADDVAEDFRVAGLTHLLAISGLHLAVAIGGLLLLATFVFRRIGVLAVRFGARRAAAAVVLPLVPLYAALVGASPSATRAAVMVGALLVAQIVRRVPDPWSALSLALLILLSWDPAGLGDVSFQLSFAAVAALLRIFPALVDATGARTWPRWTRWPSHLVLASAAATIGTMPLVARHFSRISLIGLLAGLPAIPITSLVLVPLALTGGLVSLLSPAAGGPLIDLAGLGAEALAGIAAAAAAVPFAAVRVPTPTILECLLFYSASIAWSLRPRTRGNRRFAAVSLAALVLVFTGLQIARVADGDLQIAFLPVGQGDSAIIELPHGQVIVVDTGPEGAVERVVAPYLHRRRYTKVDLLIITHPHADHDAGLETLLAHFPVDRIWYNGDPRGDADRLTRLKAHGAEVVSSATPPLSIAGAELTVLAPSGPPGDSINDHSIVFSLELEQRRFLFTGDAELDAEAALLHGAADRLRADVLKVGHHGSETSSTQAFLQAVKPRHAVISVGHANRFGLPDASIVARIAAGGAEVWRTDDNGLVIVRTDGRSLDVVPFIEALGRGD